MATIMESMYLKELAYLIFGLALIFLGVLIFLYSYLWNAIDFFRGLSVATLLIVTGIIIILIADQQTKKLERI